MIAALCNSKVVVPFLFESNCNKGTFLHIAYVQAILMKELTAQ
ncbi:hypothetical protein [Orientia tsutsugamushi]|nr:IS630 family transposase [Orientia tsutsugamushi]